MGNIDFGKIVTTLITALLLGAAGITGSWIVAAFKFEGVIARVSAVETKVKKIDGRIDTIAILQCRWATMNNIENSRNLCFEILKKQ